jgi:hypothetical protein
MSAGHHGPLHGREENRREGKEKLGTLLLVQLLSWGHYGGASISFCRMSRAACSRSEVQAVGRWRRRCYRERFREGKEWVINRGKTHNKDEPIRLDGIEKLNGRLPAIWQLENVRGEKKEEQKASVWNWP